MEVISFIQSGQNFSDEVSSRKEYANLFSYMIRNMNDLLTIIGDEHPEITRYLTTLKFGPSHLGVNASLKKTEELMDSLNYNNFEWVKRNDRKLAPIYEYTNYLSTKVGFLLKNSWSEVDNKVTIGDGVIGMLKITNDRYVPTTSETKGWTTIEPFITTDAYRDINNVHGGGVGGVSTVTVAHTASLTFGDNEVQPGVKYVLSFTVFLEGMPEMFTSRDATITYGEYAPEIGAIGFKNVHDRHVLDPDDPWWNFEGECPFSSVTLPTTARVVIVDWGPNDAFTSVGFKIKIPFIFPKNWTAVDLNPSTARPSEPYVLGRRPYTNWFGLRTRTKHPFSSGPLHSDLLITLNIPMTLTWTELTQPAGVSLPSITERLTVTDHSTTLTKLSNELAAMGVDDDEAGGFVGYIDSIENYVDKGLMLTELALGILTDGVAAAVGEVIRDALRGIVDVIDTSKTFIKHPMTAKLASILVSASLGAEHMIGINDISETGYDKETVRFIAGQLDEIAKLKDLPVGVHIEEAFPHSVYYAQSLALNGVMGKIATKIGKTLLNEQNVYTTQTLLEKTQHVIPLHAYTVAVFPDFSQTVNCLDMNGDPHDLYIRRVTFSEFGGPLADSGTTATVENGVGVLNFAFATQYWDEANKLWIWSMSNTAEYTEGIDVSGTFVERKKRLDDFFFYPPRERTAIFEYTPLVPWVGFSQFILRYRQLAGNYNLFNFNCQDMATEIMKYLRYGDYPDWWTPKDINTDIFDSLKWRNARMTVPALTPVQFDTLETALQKVSATTHAFGLGE
jgi:hypothetical protein